MTHDFTNQQTTIFCHRLIIDCRDVLIMMFAIRETRHRNCITEYWCTQNIWENFESDVAFFSSTMSFWLTVSPREVAAGDQCESPHPVFLQLLPILWLILHLWAMLSPTFFGTHACVILISSSEWFLERLLAFCRKCPITWTRAYQIFFKAFRYVWPWT